MKRLPIGSRVFARDNGEAGVIVEKIAVGFSAWLYKVRFALGDRTLREYDLMTLEQFAPTLTQIRPVEGRPRWLRGIIDGGLA